MTCLDDDLVLGLVEGRLAAPMLAKVDAHLDDCDTCRDVVAQVARVQAPAKALVSGQQLGRYVVGEVLGEGAMGRVYAAFEPELERRVALKLLVAGDVGARDRVLREAQAMAKLDHPNVVGVHEVGTAPEGVFVAMDLVDGDSLRTWAQTQHPWRDAVAILVDIARGLAAVHAAGVVHRDIKPDNIIVGTDGRARLGDFGLARAGAITMRPLADVPFAAGTPATAVAGTPAYMAPEVMRGGAAAAASDQFSFGVTAYEVLSGKRPFHGTTWSELLAAVDADTVAPLRGVPGWLDAAVRRCLAVDPAHRFPSMSALAAYLTAHAGKRGATRWIAGIAVAAAVASGVTFLALERSASPERACELGSAALAGVWNEPVRQRLAGLGSPALRALDAWAARWIDEHDALCSAAKTESSTRIAAREHCLDRRRAELAALIESLATTARGDRVADALAMLSPPSECRSLDRGASDPVPLDPQHAALVHGVERELPTVRAAIALGDARPVLGEATKLVEDARTSGHAPTLAEALLVHTDALRGTSQLAEAAATAREAIVAAERGHADLVAARAWLARVATAGDQRDLALADELAPLANAAIDRAGAPPHLVASLFRLRGLVAYNRGKLVEARTLLEQAHMRWIEAAGKDSVEISTIESALGSVARAAGELDIAAGWHRRALERDRTLRGLQHPLVARDLHNLAGVLRLQGDLDAAAATYREALEIEIATRGPRSVEVGLTRNSLGLVHLARRDLAAGRTELALAHDLLAAGGHGDAAFADHNLGLVEAAAGNHAAALTHYERAAAAYQGTIGATATPALRLLLDRARSELALGRTPDATTHARAARDAARGSEVPWIAEDAAELLARIPPQRKKPSPPEPAVRIEPAPPSPPPAMPLGEAAPAAPPQRPSAPMPKRDIGVYGSTQTW
ncbi:MAG: serine/threonine-protein kinase [Kofleriaceae bacterium]|nr:serine/threonine-protein kinase [Kofleriaceae bacterium]